MSNVKGFGAIGDGESHPLSERFGSLGAAQAVYPCARDLTDEIDWAAIQTVCSNVSDTAGGSVYVPAGDYQINYPVRVTQPSTTFYGDGPQSLLNCTLKGGMPLVLVIPTAYPEMPLTTSLATGPGQAYDTSSGSFGRYLNFRDCAGSDIDGLTALTVECFIKCTDLAAGGNIISSRGARTQFETQFKTQAFALQIDPGGDLRANFTTTDDGLIEAAVSSVIVESQIHHIAISYDGAHVRTFVDGVQKIIRNATGTVVQKYFEDMTIGASPSEWPDGSANLAGIKGAIDAVWMRNTGAYTANFTPPTSKPTTIDSTTLIICNFEDVQDSICLVHEGPSLGSAFLLHRAEPTLFASSIRVKDLSISPENGSGVFCCTAPGTYLDNISVSLGRDGFRLWNNCYSSSLNRLNSSTCAYRGLTVQGACYLLSIRDFQSDGSIVPMILSEASGSVVIKAFLYAGSMQTSLIAKGAVSTSLTLIDVNITDENQVIPAVDNFLLAGLDSVTLIGCRVANGTATISPVRIQGGSSASLIGCTFDIPAGTPACVVETNSPANVAEFMACYKSQPGVPFI